MPNQEITHVAAPNERIVAVIESINSPNIQIPGREAESTRAYIIGVRNADGSFSLYIYLHQIVSNQPAVYVFDQGSVGLAQYPEIEGEAIQFVESMGFMLDNLNFRRMQPAQQAAVIERMPVFHSELSRFAQNSGDGKEAEGADGDGDSKGAAGEAPAPIALLEELEPLESIEPLDVVTGLEEELPLASVEESGLVELTQEERSEIGSTFATTAGAALKLEDEDKQRLVRLLVAF